jgi:hypothetical protein
MKYKFCYTLIIIIIVFIGIILYNRIKVESFYNFFKPYSTPPKRNVSYDLRCEPIIPKMNISIWNNSTINPFINRCIV